MKKYICTVCEYIYDPEQGDPESGIEPGTAFEDIPDDWTCPLCGVEAAEAKQRESLATYEKTVQGAFKEMRDALTRQQEMSNVVASLERMVKELRLSVELANTRYDNGYSSYLEVLDAERSLFDSEMQLAAARSERLSSIVNVCLALGGGWK